MDWNQVESVLSEEDSKLLAPCTLWPVDLKLTHIDYTPDNPLVHFQGQYVTMCELDYNILQVEIQNAQKTKVALKVGEFCLVEDFLTNRWYRGRVQKEQNDLFDVFLLDHGNVLTVNHDHLASVSDALLALPPKIICGFFANVLPVEKCWHSMSEKFFSSMIDSHIQGYIHALLPYKVLILEVPDISKTLARLNLGRHVDTDTFLFLVDMLLEEPMLQSRESVPDLLIEKQIAQEIFFKSSSLQGFKNIASLSGVKLVVGEKRRVRITAAVNSGLFYCQLSSVAKDLEDMSKKLTLECESRSTPFGEKPVENLGLLCAMKGKDEKWHRGFVQCLPVNSQVKVVFVDYGYCESVKVENIHQLPLDFLQTPLMAFPCSMSCLSNQQMETLRDGLLGKELEVTVDALSKENNVYLLTLNSVEGYAHTNTGQCNGTDELANTGITRSALTFYCNPIQSANKTKGVKTSEEAFYFGDKQDGTAFEAYVEHVQSPHDFWMRTTERNESFERMMNKLTEYFSGIHLNEETLKDLVPGTLCCAMYEKDMHYYRALVVDTLENGAEVFFIDFGNTEKVPSMLIKKLPTEFEQEPKFAVSCSLAHIFPKDDVWTVSTIDFFRRITLRKALMVQVIHKRNDTFDVELHEERTGESIAALMTREGMAEHWRCNWITTPLTHEKEEREVVKKNFGKGHFRKGVPQNSPGNTARKEHLHPDEAIMEKQDSTDGPQSIANASKMIKSQKYQPGAEINVLCSYVTSPSDFWCQNKRLKGDLERLMQELQAFYQTHTVEFQPHHMCCAVKFHQDNRWYRGCTIGDKKDDVVEVILVDYGMVVKKKMQNIQALMPEFFELEGQAFRCSLYNLIEPVENGVWSEEACTLFKDFVSGSSELTCKFYAQLCLASKGLCDVVDLHTPCQYVSSHLVKKGVAVQIQSPKPLVPSAYPCSFVYSSFDVKLGDKELVYVTHVASPWEIYVQLDRNTELIEQLMERITEESQELLKKASITSPGSVCLTKYFGDGKWYRSFAWPAQSDLHLNVVFVDYGNKQVAEKRNVLPIPRDAFDLLLTPMQALRCSLSGITVSEQLPEVSTWLEKNILNKALTAMFVAIEDSGHFICDLCDGNTNMSEKLKELFATLKQNEDNSVQKSQHDCHKKVPRVGKFKTVPKIFNKLQKSSHDKKAMPSNSQSCQKRQVKKIEGNKCNTSGTFKKKKMPNINDLPDSKIRPGFSAVGFISHCNSSDSFFIQMEDDEQNILLLEQMLNSHVFTENMKNIPTDVKVGDVFAAEYEEDQALYRAVVSSIASSGTFMVEFIDYGNMAVVDRKKMYMLTSHFLVQPRLSTPCTLKKPHPFEDVDYFTKETHNKPLVITFMQNLRHTWEVCIKVREPLHKAEISGAHDEKKKEVSASHQAKLRQDLNVPETITKVEKQGITSSLITEKTKENEPRTIEGSKTTAGANTQTVKAKYNTVYQHKTFRKQVGTKEFVLKLNPKRMCNCSNKRKRCKKQNNAKSDMEVKPDMPSNSNLEKRIPGISPNHCDVFGSKTHEPSLELQRGVGLEEQSIQECHLALDQPISASGYQEKPMDKEDVVQHLFLAPVKMDHEYLGFAAAVTTPGEFYVVLEDLLLTMTTVSNMLQDLPEEPSPLPESHLIPGTGCLVMSPEKNKWCRAEIIQCDDVSLIINLVDYGHYAHFPRQEVSKLKRLPLELAQLPKITYLCSLRGIKPIRKTQWSDDAVVFFQECMFQKNLQLYFRQHVAQAQWEVDVVAGDKNIAKELVDAGHACYIDRMLGIRFAAKTKQVSQQRNQVSEFTLSHTESTLSKKADTYRNSCEILGSGQKMLHDPTSGLNKCLLM